MRTCNLMRRPRVWRGMSIRVWARAALGLALAGAALVMPGSHVAACSCAGSTPEVAATFADAVFTGTAIASQDVPAAPGSPTTIFTFAVDGVAKGRVGARVPVLAGGFDASCGISFDGDQRWLVFASYDGAMLTTGLCSGNLPLAAGEEPPLPIAPPADITPPEGAPLSVPAPLLVALGALALVAAASLVAFRRSRL